MWYEIIPAAVVIFAGFAVPGYALYGAHYLVLGNHFRRNMEERWNRMAYQRDERITGNPYCVAGLDAIPDK